MSKRGGSTQRKWRRSGWAFAVTLALILLAAWNTAANLLYVILGGLASFGVLSAFLSRWNLKRLTVTREAPSAVYRKAFFFVDLRLTNRKWWLPSVSIRIETVGDPNQTVGYTPIIPARNAAVLCITQCCDKRGIHPLPDIELVTSFPFGLVEVRRRVRQNLQIVVYPRIIPLRTRALDLLADIGGLSFLTTGDTNEYFSLREYVAGDDIRRIAWKASARLRQWMVRDYQEQRARHVLLVFDTSLPSNLENREEVFEETVEMLASLAVALLGDQCYVAIIAPTGSLTLGSGKSHVFKALDFLARVEPASADGARFAPCLTLEQETGFAVVYVSADPSQWGRRASARGARTLDPRELVRA